MRIPANTAGESGCEAFDPRKCLLPYLPQIVLSLKVDPDVRRHGHPTVHDCGYMLATHSKGSGRLGGGIEGGDDQIQAFGVLRLYPASIPCLE